MFLGRFFPLLWLAFEVVQLLICERYLSARVYGDGVVDPRSRGPRESAACVWVSMLVLYYGWMLLLFFQSEARMKMGALLLVSLIGFSIRRLLDAKRVFSVLMFEGALRIGILVSLL